MSIEITEEPTSTLAAYASVPIAFTVREVLAVVAAERGLGGLRLERVTVDRPFDKDYDAIPGNHPDRWASRFDVGRWGVLAARMHGRRVGGAVIAWDSPGLDMLEGRTDLAVLWDLRVAPEARRHGVGTALFAAAERWASARGARWLKVETQSVNVPACRFYAGRGCTLGAIDRFAYPALPDEAQLLWYKALAAGVRDASGDAGGIEVRAFTPADAAGVAATIATTMRISNARDYRAERLEALIAYFTPAKLVHLATERRCLVAEAAGHVVGTGALEDGELLTFFVHPAWQGRGVGSRLLAALEHEARASGLASLRVNASVTGAGFYERHGYRRTGAMVDGTAGLHVAMAKRLDEAPPAR